METRLQAAQKSCQRVAGILLAAGSSTRMQQGDKLLMQIGRMPASARSFAMFEQCDALCCVAVVTNPLNRSAILAALNPDASQKKVITTEGGNTRKESVLAGISVLDANGCLAELLAVHDGARPLADVSLLDSGIKSAAAVGAAAPVIPISDSLKRVQHGLITATIDRDGLFATQTPQVFKREVLKSAHEAVTSDVKDDAEVVELAGGLVSTFPGNPQNIKLTTTSDVVLANALISRDGLAQHSQDVRYGVGFDMHKLAKPGPLRLGGVDIDFDMRLEGHSDGDVLMHAIASAILGAAKQGDLGSRFPSSDSRFSGMDSSYFVQRSTELAADSGWSVTYIDSTVIAARPRISPHYDAMVDRISDAAGLAISKVNVKSTTTDGVGNLGSGEGIGAQAVATVTKLR